MSLSPAYTPSSTPSFLARRRIATYFTGGTNGVLTLVTALQQRGFTVHDMSVDIRDGVPESSMVCTVMVTSTDIDLLLEHLRDLPSVVSSELV
ncbi:hypothetical protein [Haloechinothrix salitolerans]|uniref:ACT domain-containing protein n=1 Tax=Haloechinothrix salitolerans TaxID=926830 RepID=A0ABW2BZF4_9PSEU